MKKMRRQICAAILAVFLCVWALPSAALAAGENTSGGDKVLTSISHADCIDKVDATGKTDLTLTVLYSFSGTVDLAERLDITYNKSTYSTAVARFPDGADATVDGEPVRMVLVYQKSGSDALYNTEYTIRVVRASYKAPSFSGTLKKSISAPGIVTFDAADFTSKYEKNDGGALASLSIDGTMPTFGTLKFDGRTYTQGQTIGLADIGNKKLSFEATKAGEVSFVVSAYAENSPKEPVGTMILTITASTISPSSISFKTQYNTAVGLTASNFNSVCRTVSSEDLLHVSFTLPSSSSGTLYYNYKSASNPGTAVKAEDKYYYSAVPELSKIYFVPKSGYSGTVTIAYTATTVSGYTYDAKFTVTVARQEETIVVYSTDSNSPVTFNSSDFNTVCRNLQGANLSHVKFTLPSSSYGKLYYEYSASTGTGSSVSASTAYYRSASAYLSSVTFVPNKNYNGTVTLNYTGYDVNNKSYSGTVRITVSKPDENVITYNTDGGVPAEFSATDFNTVCRNRLGADLSYVKFSLPSSSYGKLYYEYTSSGDYDSAVTSSRKYYRSSSPYLSGVSFVPDTDYNGRVSISYTGYDVDGYSYSGEIIVNVTRPDESILTYTTPNNTPLVFDASDFNDICQYNRSKNLSYVQFTLPSSSYGKLYYDYSAASGTGTAVSASTKYYRSSSPYLASVAFVPNSSYTGKVTINYTAYDVDGGSYSGKMQITLTKPDETVVYYNSESGVPLTFSSSDFNTACRAKTGYDLNYVQFSLPSSSYGKLYFNYSSSSQYDSTVSSSVRYYRNSSPGLSLVTFVPTVGISGTITLSYTGYNTNGNSYSGKVTIAITKPESARISYSTDSNTPIRFDPADFNDVCRGVNGETLNYVTFILPSSSYGTLYYDYVSSSNKGSSVSSSTKYYRTTSPSLSLVTFVPKSSYSGTVTINYSGVDSEGGTYTGKVLITVAEVRTTSKYFTDVKGNYSWAVMPIDTLYEKGVVKGQGNSLFSPGQSITRGDFMLMLYRAFNLRSTTGTGFSDVPSNSYYYNAINVAKALGIAQGYDNHFRPDDPLTREDAMVLIYRTLNVIGESPSSGGYSNLSGFSDRNTVSDYAITAMGTLVKAGYIQGTDGYLYPKNNITRAEMATILYRVL